MKLSIITIGQSPREDFNEFFSVNKALKIEQVGILDNYVENVPKLLTDKVLVSKLRNGEQVKMDESFVIEKVNEIVGHLNKYDSDMILLACTGEFGKFNSKIPIVYPDILVGNVIKSIFKDNKKMGVLVPDRIQKENIKQKWGKTGIAVEVFEISPYKYNETDINNVCGRLNENDIDYVICDCMGYNRTFKNKLLKKTNKNIILSNEVVFNNIFSIIS